MNRIILLLSLLLMPFIINASKDSPYVGQQQRSIKSLSQSDIDGYLQGKGMGFAKAAELNHYPGPQHVLDLATQLKLSKKQLEQTQALFDKMQKHAIELGKQLISQERKLDQMFAKGTVNKKSLEDALQQNGKTLANLRYVHLSTHLEQKNILNKHQIMLYDNLRGYGANASHNYKHNHTH